MQNYNDEQQVNIGVGNDISIKEIAYQIADIIGYKGNFNFDSTKPDGTPRKLLDVSKINQLGWHAAFSLEKALNKLYNGIKKTTI